MRDSLIKFRDLFGLASDEEKKYLLHLMIPRIIWTPEEIKIALYDRPINTGRISGNSNIIHDSDVSLEFGNWLPVLHVNDNWIHSFKIDVDVPDENVLRFEAGLISGWLKELLERFDDLEILAGHIGLSMGRLEQQICLIT